MSFDFFWENMISYQQCVDHKTKVQLIAIFGAANESIYYTTFAVKPCRVYLCMVIFVCVNKAAFIFLPAFGKIAASTMLSMVREIVFCVGFAVTLPVFFGLVDILNSMPIPDILTAIISAIVIVAAYRQPDGKSDGVSPVKAAGSTLS